MYKYRLVYTSSIWRSFDAGPGSYYALFNLLHHMVGHAKCNCNNLKENIVVMLPVCLKIIENQSWILIFSPASTPLVVDYQWKQSCHLCWEQHCPVQSKPSIFFPCGSLLCLRVAILLGHFGTDLELHSPLIMSNSPASIAHLWFLTCNPDWEVVHGKSALKLLCWSDLSD